MLEDNFLLNVNIIEALRRKSADILYESSDGIVIYERDSKVYMISIENRNTEDKIIEYIPKNADFILAHQTWYCDKLMKRCNLHNTLHTYHSVWIKDKLLEKQSFDGEIKKLTLDNLEEVINNYSSMDIVDREYMQDRISSGNMIGAFIDGKLCGFIGNHPEGTIGLLEVLPDYRRKGIGMVLLTEACNNAINEGRIPFGEIKVNNKKSIALQAKLNFSISKDPIIWLTR